MSREETKLAHLREDLCGINREISDLLGEIDFLARKGTRLQRNLEICNNRLQTVLFDETRSNSPTDLSKDPNIIGSFITGKREPPKEILPIPIRIMRSCYS